MTGPDPLVLSSHEQAQWLDPATGWLAQITAQMRRRHAHPARTVVLLPYAQLMPLAAKIWAFQFPQGFAPRFETTLNWCRSLGGYVPAPSDYCSDPALDSLTAQALLERAGLREQAELAAPMLLASMGELAPLAAAQPPAGRQQWGRRSRAVVHDGFEAAGLGLEAAVAQVALAWAASSSYPSDKLFTAQVMQGLDCLIVLPGFQQDPLLASLQQCWGERMAVLEPSTPSQAGGQLQFHAASDEQDEAQQAAACVLRHLEQGRSPLALVVIDRALTRRIRAMLEAHGVQLRDETGWKLSTSHLGAQLMAGLRACAWNASTDSVLDWLKQTPAIEPVGLTRLEAQLRRRPLRLWRQVPSRLGESPELEALLAQVNAWRAPLQAAHTLTQWLALLRGLLQACGLWHSLQQDRAGAEVLAALRLSGAAPLPVAALWASRRMNLRQFTHWVDQVLEAESFKPESPAQEQVVLLPLAQMLGRPFAAVVLAACDESRLQPSPEPAGVWTAAQRAALGLPARESLEAKLRSAWLSALQRPVVDLLWRIGDEGGEPLLPSPLVQLARLSCGQPALAPDPRIVRALQPAGVALPAPPAPALALSKVSASAYQDLRHCPYRYFALRLLGLREAEEIEGELDKRDFGLWLHAVLQRFHAQAQTPDRRDLRRQQLDQAAQAELAQQGLAPEEFLPYLASWPGLREAYLDWLAEHESKGWQFQAGESDLQQSLDGLQLLGRLDRIDQSGDGSHLVLDYKTEQRDLTSRRIKEPLEDTQLAFYAALMPRENLRAAYLSLVEREPVRMYEQSGLLTLRDALLQGMRSDLTRISAGAALPALGEGRVCETCQARGLCRKDFWGVA